MSEFHLAGCNRRGEFRRVFDYFDRIACLGRKEDAINEGKKAVELLPESEDAVEGPKATAALAEIYASVGEHDEAFLLLDHLLAVPNGLTVPQLRSTQSGTFCVPTRVSKNSARKSSRDVANWSAL
jgi:tetratricopeptide (TPR) repeat protein